ncbi:MAG TPA: S-layer homology domain-containing protein [Thermoanaerobacterales bacterium]|nr:S-layer homology domain-containing protein [Thermoanaerobacterales bacterium]
MYNLKRMKKVLAILTVFVFVAGIMGTGAPAVAKAASDDKSSSSSSIDVVKLTSDITDKDTKDAVLRLVAFGIVNGMDDGKYHPGDNVTREQFAKILVTSLKMDSAAKAATGRSSFKDVEASRWSAGYINVAVGQGLIKGYPDGTFQPAKEVTYAEAITMLVRALGYKDSFLTGTWPGNYLAKAAEKEITKKVKFSDATGIANRGDVAILVNNTLDAKVVKVDTYESSGTKYLESDKTLLEDKLNITKYKDVRIIANRRIDDGLNEDEIRVKFLKDTEDNKYDEGEEKDFDIVYDVNLENVLGEESTIYLNDDDEIVYAEKEYDDNSYFDYIEGVVMNSDGKTVDKLSLVKADDDYAFDKDAVIYMMDGNDYKTVEYNKVTDTSKLLGKVGKFVIKNRKIVWAEIMSSGETQPWMIVTKNDSGMLYGIVGDDDEYDIDLKKGEDYDGVIVLDTDGNKLKVDDIEKGNLVYIQKQDIGGDDYAVVRVVKNNTVEGKLNSVKDDRINVNGKEIKVTKYSDSSGKVYEAYYSVNDGEDISQYLLSDSDVASDMEDADEENIIAYTDAVGRIAYFVTKAEATSGYKYGIVTKKYADGDKLKIFTIANDGTGDEITYNMEEDDNLKLDGAYALNEYGQKTKSKATVLEGSIVKFKLNKDGEIAEDEIYVMDPKNVWKISASDDFGKDYLPKAYRYSGYKYDSSDKAGANLGTVGSATESYTFSVDDNIVLIDAEGYVFKDYTGQSTPSTPKVADNVYAYWKDTDDFSEASWSQLKSANGIDGYFYVFCDDTKKVNAKAAIFIGKGSGAASNDEMGIYVIDTWLKSGDRYVKYEPYDGKVEERKLDDKNALYNGDEHPYIAKVKSNGDLTIINPKTDVSKDDFKVLYGKVKDRDATSLTMEKVRNMADGSSVSKTQYNISSKTVVYEEDSKKSTSNIRSGDMIIFVVEKDSNVRAIERLIDNEKTDFADRLENGKPGIGESGGGGTTPPASGIKFDIGSSSTATITGDYSRSVAVSVYADISWDSSAKGSEINYEVTIDENGIKASNISARSVANASYDKSTNTITFNAVFKEDVYPGDKLQISADAITITAKSGTETKQTATSKSGSIGISKR